MITYRVIQMLYLEISAILSMHEMFKMFLAPFAATRRRPGFARSCAAIPRPAAPTIAVWTATAAVSKSVASTAAEGPAWRWFWTPARSTYPHPETDRRRSGELTLLYAQGVSEE